MIKPSWTSRQRKSPTWCWTGPSYAYGGRAVRQTLNKYTSGRNILSGYRHSINTAYKMRSLQLKRDVYCGRANPSRTSFSSNSRRWNASEAHSSRGSKDMITTEFVRRHVLNLEPYVPIVPFEVLSGETVSVLSLCGLSRFVPEQLQRPTDEIVKLDANENPYGPPPGWVPF